MLLRHGRLPVELIDAIIDEAAYWAHAHAEVDFQKSTGHDLNVTSRNRNSSMGGNCFLLRTPPLGFQRAPVRGGEGAQRTYTTAEPVPEPLATIEGADGNGSDGDGAASASATASAAAASAAAAACSPDDIRKWLPADHAPLLEHPCRKIVFTIESHDQGWANNMHDRGTYERSYSWFDVGLERYGWRGGQEDKKSSTKDTDTHTDTHTDTDTDTNIHPLAPSVPETAALYTIRPSVIVASSMPSPGDGHRSFRPQIYQEQQRPSLSSPSRPWRFDFALNPGADRLQSNRVATRDFTKHRIVWSWTDEKPPLEEERAPPNQGQAGPNNNNNNNNNNTGGPAAGEGAPIMRCPLDKVGRGSETGDGSFVRDLRVGDVVTVWAKARYPGWVNTVRRVQVDVYWAV